MGGIKKVRITDSNYPVFLRTIPSPPKQLYYIGNLFDILHQHRLSVVGSRRVSPYGRAVTRQLSGEVASQGIIIISGLALGVDGLAHEAALEAGGQTIAVLPCGLDAIYPASHRQLAQRIVKQGGALVSEYGIGTPPLAQHFIARNRIVSGLGEAVLITEAADKSGTLHTANFALEQGRTVLAVPGNITSLLSRGTNNLIKSGALPATESADILQALSLAYVAKKEILAANSEEATLIALLQCGISDGSELMSQSKLEPALFNQTVTMLEITGKIRPLGAGHWSLI